MFGFFGEDDHREHHGPAATPYAVALNGTAQYFSRLEFEASVAPEHRSNFYFTREEPAPTEEEVNALREARSSERARRAARERAQRWAMAQERVRLEHDGTRFEARANFSQEDFSPHWEVRAFPQGSFFGEVVGRIPGMTAPSAAVIIAMIMARV